MWDAPHCLYRDSLVTFHTVKTSLNIFTLIKSIIQQINIMYRRKDFDKAVHTYLPISRQCLIFVLPEIPRKP